MATVEPEVNEKQEEFVERCMVHPDVIGSYPNEAQRRLFCQTTYKHAANRGDVKPDEQADAPTEYDLLPEGMKGRKADAPATTHKGAGNKLTANQAVQPKGKAQPTDNSATQHKVPVASNPRESQNYYSDLPQTGGDDGTGEDEGRSKPS